MLTYALAQDKLTNQEFTPSLKWLLLCQSSDYFTAESAQAGLIVGHVHLSTPTVIDCLLYNVVKCVRKARVSSQWPFFCLKFRSVEVIQGA